MNRSGSYFSQNRLGDHKITCTKHILWIQSTRLHFEEEYRFFLDLLFILAFMLLTPVHFLISILRINFCKRTCPPVDGRQKLYGSFAVPFTEIIGCIGKATLQFFLGFQQRADDPELSFQLFYLRGKGRFPIKDQWLGLLSGHA